MTRIVDVPADDMEDRCTEVEPSVHLTDESALEAIANIATSADNWSLHELMPTGKTKRLAIVGNPARIVRY